MLLLMENLKKKLRFRGSSNQRIINVQESLKLNKLVNFVLEDELQISNY